MKSTAKKIPAVNGKISAQSMRKLSLNPDWPLLLKTQIILETVRHTLMQLQVWTRKSEKAPSPIPYQLKQLAPQY